MKPQNFARAETAGPSARQKLFPIVKIDFVLVYWEYLSDDHFATKDFLQSAHLTITAIAVVASGQQSIACCNSTEENLSAICCS